MILLIKVKDTDNVIGLKEDIAMRLEGVADIERIDVLGSAYVNRAKDGEKPIWERVEVQYHG